MTEAQEPEARPPADTSKAEEAMRLVFDVAKHLITLSSAVIAVFVSMVNAGIVTIAEGSTWLLFAFLGAFVVCVLACFGVMLAVAGTFDAMSYPERSPAAAASGRRPGIYNGNIRGMMVLMLGSFLLGLAFLAGLAG